ncbi:hypothetical protein BK809_0002964 [Diplodia seriata]|uniref:Uncharacterized protein n=1 Tax=Diplodia seriata TaxID=420778 RepID=A0A1S8BL39_9PEZI|nr:hypothetical protein BK809_0002964 [Diplodia seriata]
MMCRVINAYILGEQLLDCCFRNVLMDILLSMQDCALLVGGSNVDLIYMFTTELSPMRKLAVDWFIWLHHNGNYHCQVGLWTPTYLPLPLEFLHNVVDACIERRQPNNFSKPVQAPWDKDPCDYHSHQDGQKCNLNNTAELR